MAIYDAGGYVIGAITYSLSNERPVKQIGEAAEATVASTKATNSSNREHEWRGTDVDRNLLCRARMLERSLIVLALAAAVPLAAGCNSGTTVSAPDMSPNDGRTVDPPACAGGWLVSNVPRGGIDATYALDPDGNWHLVYQTLSLGARHVSEATIAEADSLPSYGRPMALAVSSTGAVDAFLDIVNQGILVVSLFDGVWQADGKPFLTGQASAGVGARADHAGHTHATFSDGGIRHLTDQSGQWTEQTAVSGSLSWHTMAIDSADHVHVFYDLIQTSPTMSTTSPMWATDAGASWTTTAMPAQFKAAAAVVDRAGQPHVFGTRAGDTSQHLLSYAAGNWTDETLPAALGSVQDARLDATDHYHVVGEDLATGNVVYATNASGSWVAATVLNVGANVPARGWIELDRTGVPHVAFDSELGGSDPPRHHFARPCP